MLNKINKNLLAGIYIHIPFCRQRCHYCDFYSSASPARKEEMLLSLHHELEMRRNYLVGEGISTLYFGGGTPTVYAPEELQGLIEKVSDLFQVVAYDEITVEANPDDLTEEYLERLAATQVDRLSIGIQSFHDSHLRFFNRRHTAEQARDAVSRAKKFGFDNITVDLIYGIPGMTEEEWQENLECFLKLEVPHLSAYHLTIEEHTVFGKQAARGKISPVDDAVSELHYSMLTELMRKNGYEHYEISNFAGPGYRAVHNSNYWKGLPYLGVGPSAHSFDGERRAWNVGSNKLYLDRLGSEDFFESEQLTPTDRFNEYLLTRLRTLDGASWKELSERFAEKQVLALRKSVEAYTEKGMLADNGSCFYIPEEHLLVSDYIISGLFA